MKAIELLKEYRNIDFGCDVEGLHNEIDEAIDEILLVQQELDNLTESNKELLECLQHTQTKLKSTEVKK